MSMMPANTQKVLRTSALHTYLIGPRNLKICKTFEIKQAFFEDSAREGRKALPDGLDGSSIFVRFQFFSYISYENNDQVCVRLFVVFDNT